MTNRRPAPWLGKFDRVELCIFLPVDLVPVFTLYKYIKLHT